MKNIPKTLFLLCFASILLTSCSSDDPVAPTLQEEAFAKLAGNWSLSNNGGITIDGTDISLNFPGFSLSFSDGNYTTTKAGELFTASGTWTWADESAGQINLDDGKEVIILQLTTQTFRFSFTHQGQGGTANGLAGNYEITVGK